MKRFVELLKPTAVAKQVRRAAKLRAKREKQAKKQKGEK